MFSPIEGGSVMEIQGLQCHIPPVGYVVNGKGEIEYIGVYQRSDIPEEQYWERIIPDWYPAVAAAEDQFERKKKKDGAVFFDERYEQFKKQEWHRRLYGFWFMNKGKPVYLVGIHYLFLQWWPIDIGYVKYRLPDLWYFYFLTYVIEDSMCMGMVEITKRRFGKSFRAGLFIMDYITRTKNANGGIQSKTGMDAKKFFSKTVVKTFRKLPRFFRPVYDTSLGVNPKTEMRFEAPNVRGERAEENTGDNELGSMVDHQSADIMAYDGQKVVRMVNDEFAKTLEANIYDRHEVLRFCILDDEKNIIGKLLYTSTAEKLDTDKDGVQEAAKKLWDESNQLEKGENGMTGTGLYRFFLSADFAKNIDKYGEPDVEKTIKEIEIDRASAKSKRALLARIRKEPRTIEEAFMEDDETCIFNVININAQKAWLRDHPVYLRAIQYYRDLDQKVKWRDVDADKTELCWKVTPMGLPKAGDENKHYYDGPFRKPNRTDIGVIGVDGYSNTQGGKVYGSKLSGWMFIKYDIRDPDNTGLFVGHIYGRPNDKDDMYEQILLAAEYNGFRVWFEFASDDYYGYFKDRGRLGYLGTFPRNSIAPEKLKKEKGDRPKGFPTTDFALTKQNDAMVMYVDNHCGKIYFMVLLDDLPKFKPYKRTPSDVTVSAMITLVCSMELNADKPKRKHPLVRTYPNEHYKDPNQLLTGKV